ncbi:MAG: GNAT family N-acetyltransferase [Jatrophihabitans sp.]|uniref:GNAT family N-acetyltransferase n=1 Tax=Jatrophihabitans sp. TaxID=1932789 RepID=UPI003F7F80D8
MSTLPVEPAAVAPSRPRPGPRRFSYPGDPDQFPAQLPDREYPAGYENAVQLRDGRRVTLRPVRRGDARLLGDLFAAGTPEALEHRFLGVPPMMTAAALAELTSIDYSGRFALLAFAGGRAVGTARYCRLPIDIGSPEHAWVGTFIDPDWRDAGLATEMLWVLATRGREVGIVSFLAAVVPSSAEAANIVTSFGPLLVGREERVLVEFAVAASETPM